MQASKITPGGIYAAKFENRTVRFKILAVETTQRRTGKKASPHDYASRVQGFVLEGDRVEGDPTGDNPAWIAPEAVQGPYDEYAELKAKAAAEEKERLEKEKAESTAAHALRKKFYEITGLPQPDRLDEFTQPFTVNYGSSISIKIAGVNALLAKL